MAATIGRALGGAGRRWWRGSSLAASVAAMTTLAMACKSSTALPIRSLRAATASRGASTAAAAKPA
eukprot:11194577-Lingulodinium_polyedra.AAC.1